MAASDRELFGKLEELKRMALRADKTDQRFAASDPHRRRRDKLTMNPNRP